MTCAGGWRPGCQLKTATSPQPGACQPTTQQAWDTEAGVYVPDARRLEQRGQFLCSGAASRALRASHEVTSSMSGARKTRAMTSFFTLQQAPPYKQLEYSTTFPQSSFSFALTSHTKHLLTTRPLSLYLALSMKVSLVTLALA